ncbi:hypothetical protein [Carboxydothermus pertinax]|uniref:Uncharacterized protein n=1 Tax=Carboxydothermus pertinax TaxID=870242 RepID=A0A1L8CRK8_9THEO|nr:hypothetical protein [Carboxydothermus pertinax]GAV21565.1 hypothetical protein cpu_00750 [Carboxydothermus pertinax]
MSIELKALNLVVVFEEFGKFQIKRDILEKLFTDSEPNVIWYNDPISPGIIQYNDKALDISIVDNKYQISTVATNNEIPKYFPDVLKKSLEAANERNIIAYGFNFDFFSPDLEEVKDLFKIQINLKSFQYKPKTFLSLAFEKNNLIFVFDIKDDKISSNLHVNVHHEEKLKASILANKISNKLHTDFQLSLELIKEVLESVK